MYRQVLRKGSNAVLHEEIPAAWAQYFANDDPEELDDDPEWSQAEADAWRQGWKEQGYDVAGPTGLQEEPELKRFNGLNGHVIQVGLVNQSVLDEDARNGRWSVSGTDALPYEYVLRADLDGIVRLPDNFGPRLVDPAEDVDDPRRGEQMPISLYGNAEDKPHEPATIDPDEADDLDTAWTNGACDFATLWLAVHGWELACELRNCERDGWYAERWGRTSLWLARRSRDAGPPRTAVPLPRYPTTHVPHVYNQGVRQEAMPNER